MILGIIQVRLGSKRLPGKSLKEVLGKPLLWYLYERMSAAKLIDKVILATADNAENLPIVDFARQYKIGYYAGSETDLVDRIYQSAKKYGADIIARLGADCPLADPEVIDRVITFYLENKDKFDYVSNGIKPSYPHGLDLEVVPVTTVEKAWREIKGPFWREWYSSYIVEHPDLYRTGNIACEKDRSNLRWTVDYPEDFTFVRKVFERLYPTKKIFVMDDILDLLKSEPSLGEINSMYKKTKEKSYNEAKKEANV